MLAFVCICNVFEKRQLQQAKVKEVSLRYNSPGLPEGVADVTSEMKEGRDICEDEVNVIRIASG